MKNYILIRIPTESSKLFEEKWEETILLNNEFLKFKLEKPELIENFDGTSVSEWLIPSINGFISILTLVLVYVKNSKGELLVKDGEKVTHLKNYSIKEAKDLLNELNGKEKEPKNNKNDESLD